MWSVTVQNICLKQRGSSVEQIKTKQNEGSNLAFNFDWNCVYFLNITQRCLITIVPLWTEFSNRTLSVKKIIVMLEAFTLTAVHGSLFNPQLLCMVFVILNLSEAEDQNVSHCRVYNFIKHWHALVVTLVLCVCWCWNTLCPVYSSVSHEVWENVSLHSNKVSVR